MSNLVTILAQFILNAHAQKCRKFVCVLYERFECNNVTYLFERDTAKETMHKISANKKVPYSF